MHSTTLPFAPTSSSVDRERVPSNSRSSKIAFLLCGSKEDRQHISRRHRNPEARRNIHRAVKIRLICQFRLNTETQPSITAQGVSGVQRHCSYCRMPGQGPAHAFGTTHPGDASCTFQNAPAQGFDNPHRQAKSASVSSHATLTWTKLV